MSFTSVSVSCLNTFLGKSSSASVQSFHSRPSSYYHSLPEQGILTEGKGSVLNLTTLDLITLIFKILFTIIYHCKK